MGPRVVERDNEAATKKKENKIIYDLFWSTAFGCGGFFMSAASRGGAPVLQCECVRVSVREWERESNWNGNGTVGIETRRERVAG